MLDMSKAFDTVDRNKLFEGLEHVLLPEELHLLHILTNNVKLKVKVGKEYGPEFTTLLGIMQGDCLSAILFIFYLAQALSKRTDLHEEHNYTQHPQQAPCQSTTQEHNYAESAHLAPIPVNGQNNTDFTTEPKYADDITYVSTSKTYIERTKETVPDKLHDYNLFINNTKTEEYEAPDPVQIDSSWRKCKLLGSCLDTKEDIKRRKSLTINIMKENRSIYNSKNLSITQKVRHFVMFAESTFLYHCELWTMTKTINDSIDAFHRRQLRYAIGIKYPKIVSNNKLYEITKCEKWSSTIERRRLSWLGHLMRLDPDVPARRALEEALKPTKKKKGRPPTTWISVIQKDLKNKNIDIDLSKPNATQNLETLCQNRTLWKARCGMRGNLRD